MKYCFAINFRFISQGELKNIIIIFSEKLQFKLILNSDYMM